MCLGIIGAMEEEIAKLKQIMDIDKEVKISNLTFYIGKIYGKDIVLVKSNEGKVNAAICTQTLILKFNVDKVINIGVAGALSDKLNIGGIAISNCTVEYDQDTTSLGYELGYTFGINEIYVKCDNKMINDIYDISKKEFNTCIGTILSSDKFVSDDNIKSFLKEKFENVVAVDMETASISHVCKLNDIPFCAIRAISDITKAIEYREFVNQATNNLYEVVKNYIKIL